MIECPLCGSEVDTYDLIDDEFDSTTYESHWIGVCSECGAKVKWTEVYTYSYSKNVEVVEND